MNNKTRNAMYWGLTSLVALVLVGSAMSKLISSEQSAEMAKGLGGVSNLKTLGIIELAIVAFWLFPRTGIVGTLLAVAYLGGAIAVHFVTNQPVLVPIIIQMVIWLVALYRFPELKTRLLNN